MVSTTRGRAALPLFDLDAQHASIRGELEAAVARVLASGTFVAGPEVEAFEAQFASYCATDHCIGTSNGTSAIELVLRAAGIGAGDEVITTTLSFIATVEPIVSTGATPVFVDTSPDTALIAPEAVEAAITRRTAAIVPVHLYGQPVDLDAFRALADRHGLFLLEDSAQAHGAAWRGQPAGSVGDAAIFSFFPGKNLGAVGDAGAVTTSDEPLASRIRMLHDHGRTDKYRHELVGTNARLDPLQAAVLAVKLCHLERWNEARRRHAAAYDASLELIPGVTPIRVLGDATSAYHQYVVRVQNRDGTRTRLRERGIATGVHYPLPLHRQPALAGLGVDDYPCADMLAGEVLSLPVFPELMDDQRDSVVAALAEAVGAPLAAADVGLR
jgi:dTDP-4-amino-4,6-dideoxygalactose transaminase